MKCALLLNFVLEVKVQIVFLLLIETNSLECFIVDLRYLFGFGNVRRKNFKNLKLPYFNLHLFSGLDGKMWKLTLQ